MKILRDIFRFFIYSNLFIACCSVLMMAQTITQLLHARPAFGLIAFVFCSTICSYSFHWYLTPATNASGSDRIRWLARYKHVHWVLLIPGMAGAVIYGLELYAHWPWLVFAAGITFLYSAPKIPHPWFRMLRKIAIGKTIFLAGVWMFVTTLLPLVVSDEPWQTTFTLFCINRFCLIYAICILFDYRDREYDISIGIKSLITAMNEKNIDRLFTSSILIFFLSSGALFLYGQSIAEILAIVIPGIITAALYSYSKKHASDTLYYFILDGLMALSAVLFYLLRLVGWL